MPFIWKMNFEIAWGPRYDWWVREFVGDDAGKAGLMYAVKQASLEHGASSVGALDPGVGLRDCTLAEVTTSDVIDRLADIATARALSASGLGRSVEDPAGDPAGDPAAADPGDAKIRGLHAGGAATSSRGATVPRGVGHDFVNARAIGNATAAPRRLAAGKVPVTRPRTTRRW